MKKALVLLICLFAMMAAGKGLRAQEITITLNPGWTWISYPNAEAMDIATALGDFAPQTGDIIKSQYGYTTYLNGRWRGTVLQFVPGMGYKYYSTRTAPVLLVFSSPSTPVGTFSVITAEPTNITTTSAVVGGTVTIDEGNHVFVRGVCWGTEPNPDIDGNHTTDANVTGSLSDTLTELTINTTYYVRAYVVTDYGLAYGNQQSFTTVIEYQYVDLGLPSGTLWATCNVGANAPEEYGDYFAWGETQPKDTYDWNTYQYCMGTDHTFTKYCSNSSYGYNGFTDDLTTLLPEDDAATANWGVGWRMPSKEDWQELLDNTTVTWTTRNGVNGRLFTASNGNSLFLPAAGYRGDSSFYGEGSIGEYWSSSLCFGYPVRAWFLYFNSDGCHMSDYGGRLSGHSVRPVRAGSQNASFFIDATANPTEGGEISGAGTYQEGTECTLMATANEGYTFTNWTENDEAVSVEATYTFIVNADRTLVANFTLQSFTIGVSANPSNGGSVSGGDNYNYGQSCTLTATPSEGYVFNNWMENGMVVSTDVSYSFTVTSDRTLIANFEQSYPIGAINSLFTINSNGDQVYFSHGNLQYQASTNTWRFAENQYDFIGEANSNISQTYAGWIDLFGWGTSGWDNGNTYYHPWDSNTSGGGRSYGPQYNNLTGLYANADWGVYNPISNGDNTVNHWRTMTITEWRYVFYSRSTNSGIRYAKAKVNNINGVILLPDDWSTSTYSLSNTNSSAASFISNTITATQWITLESAGAVFLPVAGYRNGTSLSVVNSQGSYWSASCYGDIDFAYGVFITNNNLAMDDCYYGWRCFGFSVRLVRNAE